MAFLKNLVCSTRPDFVDEGEIRIGRMSDNAAPVLLGRIFRQSDCGEPRRLLPRSDACDLDTYSSAGDVQAAGFQTTCSRQNSSTSTYAPSECSYHAGLSDQWEDLPLGLRIRAEISDTELAALVALETNLGKQGLSSISSALAPGEVSESLLLRFLRAHHMRHQPTARSLRSHMLWREANRPDLLRECSASEVAGCKEDVLTSHLPGWHQGLDRTGRPIIFSDFGKFQFPALLEAGVTEQSLIRLHILANERIAKICADESAKAGRDISEAVLVIDVQDMDPRVFRGKSALGVFGAACEIGREHYPNRIAEVLIINAPPCVQMFYKTVEWLVPEQMRRRVRILPEKHQWLPALLSLCEAVTLPAKYGGHPIEGI